MKDDDGAKASVDAIEASMKKRAVRKFISALVGAILHSDPLQTEQSSTAELFQPWMTKKFGVWYCCCSWCVKAEGGGGGRFPWDTRDTHLPYLSPDTGIYVSKIHTTKYYV